jgi:hypothetical protein
MGTNQTSLDHLTWENPMGEARKDALQLDYDRKLNLARLLAYGETYGF